ncbi:hypothetical protein FOCG_17895 [Fusarium oxysporum f. sp. radicis-lycopersici 26381]|nr:hypothetical protein FOCG_17895 [Fusarium oxysporum f. sp. radicis-lycopersici 26381]
MSRWINREVEWLVAGGDFSADFRGEFQRPHQKGTTRMLCRGLPVQEDGEDTHCTRRLFLKAALASPRRHLLRPLGGLLDHAVCGTRGMRWLKKPLEKDGAADIEIDTKDKEVSAKLLE